VFDTILPDAVQVADPFHLVKLANQRLDEVRRRVQNEMFGHRGHRDDPLYRARRLLTRADERLNDLRRSKLLDLLGPGDPRSEVRTAWHHCHVSNGPTEAVNNLVKRAKRVAFGVDLDVAASLDLRVDVSVVGHARRTVLVGNYSNGGREWQDHPLRRLGRYIGVRGRVDPTARDRGWGRLERLRNELHGVG
jgi:hypothetical protein